ncbi:MAG: hypothetical protein FD170_1761 [Bacteroidetes bacterium]|nr:MAG: hypothetical protein FD170_1761 [Bacteroidota bacterium]
MKKDKFNVLNSFTGLLISNHYCPVKIEKILATIPIAIGTPRLQNTQNELIKLVIFGDLVHWWHIIIK